MTLICALLAALGFVPSACPVPVAPAVAPDRAPEVAPSPTVPSSPPVPTPIPEPWASLAECESHGQWDYDPATATWGSRVYEGGLQFLPKTWDDHREPGMPVSAFLAPPEVQIEVAESVLAEQGWRAWPHCSRELGLR